jgi:hypothetical protein
MEKQKGKSVFKTQNEERESYPEIAPISRTGTIGPMK